MIVFFFLSGTGPLSLRIVCPDIRIQESHGGVHKRKKEVFVCYFKAEKLSCDCENSIEVRNEQSSLSEYRQCIVLQGQDLQ